MGGFDGCGHGHSGEECRECREQSDAGQVLDDLRAQVAALAQDRDKMRDLAAHRRDELVRVRERHDGELKAAAEKRKALTTEIVSRDAAIRHAEGGWHDWIESVGAAIGSDWHDGAEAIRQIKAERDMWHETSEGQARSLADAVQVIGDLRAERDRTVVEADQAHAEVAKVTQERDAWRSDRCLAAKPGETTYECRAEAPCGVCLRREERDRAREEIAKLKAHRTSRAGLDLSTVLGYEAGAGELESVRAELAAAIEALRPVKAVADAYDTSGKIHSQLEARTYRHPDGEWVVPGTLMVGHAREAARIVEAFDVAHPPEGGSDGL